MPKMLKGGLYDGVGSEEDVERIKLSKEEKKKLVQDIMSFNQLNYKLAMGKLGLSLTNLVREKRFMT